MESKGRVQNEAMLLTRLCKVDRRPLDAGPRPKRGTVRCLTYDIILEGNTNGPNQETKLTGGHMF